MVSAIVLPGRSFFIPEKSSNIAFCVDLWYFYSIGSADIPKVNDLFRIHYYSEENTYGKAFPIYFVC